MTQSRFGDLIELFIGGIATEATRPVDVFAMELAWLLSEQRLPPNKGSRNGAWEAFAVTSASHVLFPLFRKASHPRGFSSTEHGIVNRMKDVIVQESNPVLRRIADLVPEKDFGSPGLTETVEQMLAALDKEKDGVALAAPQIGISLRIFVVRHERMHPDGEGTEPDIGVYINPEIIKTSRRSILMEEGCLSVRRIYGKVLRHERATVRARHTDGTVFERGGGGILAQVFQHETDHLDGILFIDQATDLVEITEEQYERARER